MSTRVGRQQVRVSRKVRVYVAGAPDAPITHAALEALVRNPRVILVGLDLERLDPGRLRSARPDVLLPAAHRYFIRAPERGVPRLGSVGLHPALLPKYRGSHPLWWALRNGEDRAGITLFVLDDGIDTGPVLDQRAVPIEPGDTFGTLYSRTVAHVGPMLDQLIRAVVVADALPSGTAQDESEASLFRAPTHRDIYGPPTARVRRGVLRTVRRVAAAVAAFIGSLAEIVGPGAGPH